MKKKKLFTAVLSVILLSSAIAAAEEADETKSESSGAAQPEASGEQKKKPKVFEAGEIVVRSEKIPTVDQASTQSVISAEDIEAHGDKSLDDSLQLIPGFSIYQHGKGHIRFRMRGFEMPYVALLVDGIPLSDVYEANVDISKIPVMNASEIIVNRGTCSALYGTTGTVGSINIITQKPQGLYLKGGTEYGANGDYTINASHGNTIGDFYYWLTATVIKQAPYEVSKKLDKKTRRKWFNKFFPDNLGYTVNSTNTAADTYLNDTGEWPHETMLKYNISGKSGYAVSDNLETGISASYTSSKSQRYSLSASNTEDYTKGSWSSTDPTLSLSANSFNWRDTYSYTAAPYFTFDNGEASLRGNVFYSYSYEFLDGYQDEDETVPVRGWGGAHSNWNNTSAGFNLFPSWKVASWNTVRSSMLFRWDKHLERVKADSDFVGLGSSGGNADAAYALAGYDWFDTKLMTGRQLTVAFEDEIDFKKLVSVPLNVSAGASYDAQKLDTYKARATTMSSGRVTAYGTTMDDQYIAESDATIWGTRDSFNPVVAATLEPFTDRLLLRGSFSEKSKLPTMSQYANVLSTTDTGLKPEKSYNSNVGFQLFGFEKRLSFRADYFLNTFKNKLATVYDSVTPSIKYYTNISGERHQGFELIAEAQKENAFGFVDLSGSCSYTFLKAENLDTDIAESTINKGSRLADIPAHQVQIDLRADFRSKTAIDLFGSYTANAVKYVMKSNPSSTDEFSTDYYTTVKLHDPLFVTLKISQRMFEKYEFYVACKNIFDDYAADPLNPGAGRQFVFGAKGEI